MQSIWDFKILFYCFWASYNCFLAFLEFLFLFHFRNKNVPNKISIIFYVFIVGLLTIWGNVFSISVQLKSILSLCFLWGYCTIVLKQKWIELLAPFIVIFTLSTYMEGVSAIIMFYLAKTMTSSFWGSVLQLFLSICLAAVYGGALHFIVKRYHITTEMKISPYLYVLLLPCSLMAAALRNMLGLDTDFVLESLQFIVHDSNHKLLFSFCWILGAITIFCVIIEAFYKLTILSMNETEKIQLNEKIKMQSVYINEAKKRNEQYRSFQHDINNHLLVLTGLLQKKEYEKAIQYLKDLHFFAHMLSVDVSTGNTILDVLLMEKIRYARQNEIAVTCNVHIPAENNINDMDLCILFANSLDNAIQACKKASVSNKSIFITAKQRYGFFLIDIINGIADETKPFIYGTGLKNMKYTAEKYGGTLTIEQSSNRFRVSIFLCLNHLRN